MATHSTVVTIGGSTVTAGVLNNVTITYGRQRVTDGINAAACTVELLQSSSLGSFPATGIALGAVLTVSVTVTGNGAANRFTGLVTDVQADYRVVRVIATAYPLAQLSRMYADIPAYTSVLTGTAVSNILAIANGLPGLPIATTQTYTSTSTYKMSSSYPAGGNTLVSSSSGTAAIGSSSLTIATGKTLTVGQQLVLADSGGFGTAGGYLVGTVTSYNSATGALVVNCTYPAAQPPLASPDVYSNPYTFTLNITPPGSVLNSYVIMATGTGQQASCDVIGVSGNTITVVVYADAGNNTSYSSWTASGSQLPVNLISPGTVTITTSAQTNANLMQAIQTVVQNEPSGVLYDGFTNNLYFKDYNDRRVSSPQFTFASTEIGLAWNASKAVASFCNTATVTYSTASTTTTATTTDTTSTAANGIYGQSLNLQIDNMVDAKNAADRAVARGLNPSWQLDNLIIDVGGMTAARQQSFRTNVLIGNLVQIPALMSGAQTQYFVEGWNETITRTTWYCALYLSDKLLTKAAQRYTDVVSGVTYATVNATYRWFDLNQYNI